MTRIKEVTFLGVILDENLSWKPHISHIACKISKSIGIIGRSSPCLTKLALKTLYYSLVYPYFQYCIIVWGSTYHALHGRKHHRIKVASIIPRPPWSG